LNSIRNLWPQSTKTLPWNSYVKDALERKLHRLLCAGQLDLKTTQREIARLDRSIQEICWLYAFAGSNPALSKPLSEPVLSHQSRSEDIKQKKTTYFHYIQ